MMTSGVEDYVSTKTPSHPPEPYKNSICCRENKERKEREKAILNV